MLFYLKASRALMFFALLIISLPSFADFERKPTVNEKNSYSFDLPEIGKIQVEFFFRDCFDVLCDTSIEVKWSHDNQAFTKKIIEGGYPRISNIQADENGLIISNPGGRYESEDARFSIRFRYSLDENTFYKAESWDTDPFWNAYIEKLDTHLEQGAFAKASALVLENGTTNNGGHIFHDKAFFLKFVNAALREARRSWLQGHAKTAAKFITGLVESIPFNEKNLPSKDKAYLLPTTNPFLIGQLGEKRELFNVLAVTEESHKIIRDLCFYLLEGGESKLALVLTSQASRLQPNNPEVWFLLGEAHKLEGDTEAAIKSYQRFYSMMVKQQKTASVPSEVLILLGKQDDLLSRQRTKQK